MLLSEAGPASSEAGPLPILSDNKEAIMFSKIKIIIATLLGILILIVVLQNTEAVETKLLFMSVTMPRAALLFGTLLVGFALGVLMAGRLVGSSRNEHV